MYHRITLVERDYDCLPNYIVTYWEDNYPYQKTFLNKYEAMKFYKQKKELEYVND